MKNRIVNVLWDGVDSREGIIIGVGNLPQRVVISLNIDEVIDLASQLSYFINEIEKNQPNTHR